MVHSRNNTLTRSTLAILLALSAGAALAATGSPGSSSGNETVGAERGDVQPARLVEATRPVFPRSVNRPRLVRYPGMPASERPGEDWAPEHGLWTLKVAVALDERGEPVDARIEDNPLSRQGMVRRYERLALRAVRDWRYAPATVDGRSVASEVIMAFDFDTSLGRPLESSFEGAWTQNTVDSMTNWRRNWRVTNR